MLPDHAGHEPGDDLARYINRIREEEGRQHHVAKQRISRKHMPERDRNDRDQDLQRCKPKSVHSASRLSFEQADKARGTLGVSLELFPQLIARQSGRQRAGLKVSRDDCERVVMGGTARRTWTTVSRRSGTFLTARE